MKIFTMKLIVALMLFLQPNQLFSQTNFYLIAGTYTGGKSTGIYVYDFNSSDGSASVVDSIAIPNPSYLTVSPDQKFVYSVSEVGRDNRGGMVKAFSFDRKTGHLQAINERPSMGDNPCYIDISKKGTWVVVGNYSSGTLASFPVNKDGSLGSAASSMTHRGKGPNASRQEASHVHSTVFSPDGKTVFVPDLGIDQIKIYSLDQRTGSLGKAKDSAVNLLPGSGPRHFVFHPNKKWAYLIQELSGTVTAFDYSNNRLRSFQTISTLPAGFKGSFTSADIHVSKDGKFLYASNRDASNTIAIFKIDQKKGSLTLVGHQSTLGKTPRNFNFDPSGNFLLVANQNSDEIVVFKVDHTTGLLTDTGKRINIGSPVCIKWAEKIP
jgi:6-phosphogluconolactonase